MVCSSGKRLCPFTVLRQGDHLARRHARIKGGKKALGNLVGMCAAKPGVEYRKRRRVLLVEDKIPKVAIERDQYQRSYVGTLQYARVGRAIRRLRDPFGLISGVA
jgi:hypothetical protein